MNGFESLLILTGASVEIFAAMVGHGSVIRKLNIREISLISLIMTLGQIITLVSGYFLSDWYFDQHPERAGIQLGEVIAVVLIFTMGMHLLIKGIRNERIPERLEKKFEILKFLKTVLYSGSYTLFAGTAFGFTGTSISTILLMIILLTLIAVLAGICIGYRMGALLTTFAFFSGAIVLIGTGIDIVLSYIVEVI